jgi:hypothetical protein
VFMDKIFAASAQPHDRVLNSASNSVDLGRLCPLLFGAGVTRTPNVMTLYYYCRQVGPDVNGYIRHPNFWHRFLKAGSLLQSLIF